jgi:hypothetical protein
MDFAMIQNYSPPHRSPYKTTRGRLPTSISTPAGEHPRPPPLACGEGGGGQLWCPKKPPHSTFPFLSSPSLPFFSSSNLWLGAWLAGGVLGPQIRDPLGWIQRPTPWIRWAVQLVSRHTCWRGDSTRRLDPGGLAHT